MLFGITTEQETQRGRGNQLEHVRSLGEGIDIAVAMTHKLQDGEYGNRYETKRHYAKSGDVLEIFDPPIVLFLRIYSLSLWHIFNGLASISIAFRDILGRRTSWERNVLIRVIGDNRVPVILAHRSHSQQIVESVIVRHGAVADERLMPGHSLRPCGIRTMRDAGKLDGGQVAHILPYKIQGLTQGRTAGLIHSSDFTQSILSIPINRLAAESLELVVDAAANGPILPRLERFGEQPAARVSLVQACDEKQKLLEFHGGDVFACAECATQNAVSHSGRRKTCPDHLWLVLNISHVSNSKMGED